MPIFHDSPESPPGRSPSRLLAGAGLRSAETPSVGLERSLLDSLRAREAAEMNLSSSETPDSPTQGRKPSVFDRIELIERLKRSNIPSWQHRHGESSYQDSEPTAQHISRDCPKTPLPPPAEARPSPPSTSEVLRDFETAGLEIERPRSALHSGDFRDKKAGAEPDNATSSSSFLATSPVAPWNRSFPTAAYLPYRDEALSHGMYPKSRARAISQSTLSSFAFLPPTSPLVQQANNTDLDSSSRPGSRQSSKSPERSNRRHTYSPASFQNYQSIQMAQSASGTPAARHARHSGVIPYQAHQPRRAATFHQNPTHSSPQTPFLTSRRPSFSSEASPLQHAPMVGSYEESILRGRMSTTPSRPLNFVAKIGVLGKGQCKSSLKCPPHVTVPFPAVFYSYDTNNGRISNNEPSPYVGLIDLENSLSAPEDSHDSGKRKRRQTVVPQDLDSINRPLLYEDEGLDRRAAESFRRREKRKRRSTSPKAPPGGSYRIPAQGQLQIVLKTPSKTAVKLFLVPYDLSDMEPGQKTFIRQRSYSAGPIIDMPALTQSHLGTDRAEAAIGNSNDPNDRPRLRYLIHLHICCPSKGRYYLYKSIRVVFANRVPDGKEKLRNEIQFPEPRYSAYKPTRDLAAGQSVSSMGSQLAAERALRRRSAGLSLSQSQKTCNDEIDGLRQYPSIPPPAIQFTGGPISISASSSFGPPLPDLQPIPFSLIRLAAMESRPVSREHMDIDLKNPFESPVTAPKATMNGSSGTFEKLSRGETGYGGNAFPSLGSANTMPNASLLSQKLREIDGQRDTNTEP